MNISFIHPPPPSLISNAAYLLCLSATLYSPLKALRVIFHHGGPKVVPWVPLSGVWDPFIDPLEQMITSPRPCNHTIAERIADDQMITKVG